MKLSEFPIVQSGFLRVVTHPRVFRDPTPLSLAQEFVVAIHDHPNAVTVFPGERHWDIFAIEAGAEWITTDRDFARFPLLRWKHPLA